MRPTLGGVNETARVHHVTWYYFGSSLSAGAQQSAIPVICVQHGVSPVQWTDRMGGFHRGLRKASFVKGRNVNLKLAKTLNLTIPEPLIGRADEVIE